MAEWEDAGNRMGDMGRRRSHDDAILPAPYRVARIAVNRILVNTAVAVARKAAQAAGYYIREGSYQGTTDDCLDRWYIGHDDAPFRPWGAGYATQAAAWLAIADDLARSKP